MVMLITLVNLLLCASAFHNREDGDTHTKHYDILVDPAHDTRTGRIFPVGEPAGIVVSTIHAARDAARGLLVQEPDASVTIGLRPGLHNVGIYGALELEKIDSPASNGKVTWVSIDPSAPAVITAAVPVTGWTADPTRQGVVSAPIPADVPKHIIMRHLWVAGKRAFKPRYYPQLLSEIVVISNSSVPHGEELPWGGYYFNASVINPSTLKNPSNVEFVYTGRAGARGPPGPGLPREKGNIHQSGADPWTEPRCTIDSVHGRSVSLKQACWKALPFAGAEDHGSTRGHEPPSYLDNVEGNFTEPGQWYLDLASRVVLYRPRHGETLADVERTATTAVNSTLLVLKGARNMRWQNIHFHHAVWDPLSVDQQGYVDIQSAQIFNGSVIEASTLQLHAVRNISFTSCEFRHLGGVYAITAEGGSQGVSIENCTFTDCSGGGVKLGSVANCSTGCANAGPSPPGSHPGADSGKGNQWWPLPNTPIEQQDGDFVVTNSLFYDLPTEYHGANAIFAGYVRDTELSHNSIYNTSYSAISIGGGWPKKPSYGRNVRVVYNHLVNCMQLLADGGAVYSTSDGVNSTISYNHLDGDPVQYGAIYHDGGSANWKDTQNVIENAQTSCIFAHGSCPNISVSWSWCNNTGAPVLEGQARVLSCEIQVLNKTNWQKWPAGAQKIIDGAGAKSCWPNCPVPAPTPSPPCPHKPPSPPAPPNRFGAAACNASKLSQRWLLSPGVTPWSSKTTNVKSATPQGGCWEIRGCAGSQVDTSFGCKPLPKPGMHDKCALNNAWSLNSNGTISSLMDGQCLQIENGGVVSASACLGTAPSPPSPSPAYERLPQKESCRTGAALASAEQCNAAFAALNATLPKGARSNTKCCNGDDLPYGCTYRIDNDFVYNDNKASPASYASSGWRAVCATTPVSQNFEVTVVKAGAEVEVTIGSGGMCIDNAAAIGSFAHVIRGNRQVASSSSVYV